MTLIVLAGRDPVLPGDESDWAALVQALREEGAEVAVWVERAPAQFGRLLAHAGAAFVTLPWPTDGALPGLFRTHALRRRLAAAGARLLHLLDTEGARVLVSAARGAGVRVVISPERLPSKSDGRTLAILRRADGIEVPCEVAAGLLAREVPELASRTRVVPPGLDAARRSPEHVGGRRIAALVERWQLDPARRLVLLPGPIRRESGHLLALRAMAACERTDFDLMFLSRGPQDAAFGRELQALLRATGLAERVRFVSDCEDPAAAHAAADVVLFPAAAEVLAVRPLLEAQAAGVPVVGTAEPGREDFLLPGVTGWLVPRDPAALASALAAALDLDEAARARAAERCRRFVEAEYGLQRFVRARLRTWAAVLQVGEEDAARPRSAGGVADPLGSAAE